MYPRSFSIQDKANDVAMLKMAKEANIGDLRINQEIDKKIYETITEGFVEDIEVQDTPSMGEGNAELKHDPVISADNLVKHMREMIEQGFTDEQIKELHPELAELFNRSE